MNSDSDSKNRSKWLQTSILLLLSLLIAVGIAEAFARALGFNPWGTYKSASDVVPLMSEPHPELAWTNKPGVYDYPGYTPDIENIHVTILPDTSRSNRPDRLSGLTADDQAKKKIIFIGGSVTMGFAISDHETFAWKIQERYPETIVYNFGTPGYGTLQSLLSLEERLPSISGEKLIIYGFIGHHTQRNVVAANWIKAFSIPGKEGKLPPFARLDDNDKIVRHPVSYFPPWPLKDKLAIVNLLETTYTEFITRERKRQQYDVTQQLIGDIESFGKQNNAKLLVVLLNVRKNDPGIERIVDHLRDKQIAVADCVPDEITPDLQVQGEGHPNGKMNTRMANCIADYIDANNLWQQAAPG